MSFRLFGQNHHNLHFVCKIKDTRFVQHVNVNKKTMPDHAPCPMNMTYGFVCVCVCGIVGVWLTQSDSAMAVENLLLAHPSARRVQMCSLMKAACARINPDLQLAFNLRFLLDKHSITAH